MKIISFVLSIIMAAMPLCCVAASTGEQSYFEPAEYTEAVTILEELGIIGYDYSSPDVSSCMTRGEFAALVMSVMGISASYGGETQLFADATSDHPYAGAVNTAVSLGYFSGTSKYEFSPDSPVYINQAIKVMVTALGFKDYAESKGGYPSGYIAAANYAHITDGVDLGDSYGSARGNIMVLMYNCLRADMARATLGTDGSYSLDVAEGINILSEYHHIFFDEGIIDADWEMSVTSEPNEENLITIGGKTMVSEYDDACGSVGMNVEYYYLERSGRDMLLTFRVKDNDVISLNADEPYSYDAKTRTYTAEYEKTLSLSLDMEFDLIYNNCGADGSRVTDAVSLMTPPGGSITLINNNGDKLYDVVIIQQAAVTVFDSYDKYNKIIFDKTDSSFNINLEAYEAYYLNDVFGKELCVEDIKSGNVIMAFASADGSRLSMTVCTQSINGLVSELGSDGTVYIGDGKYKLSANARDGLELRAGMYCTAYLDSFGDIVYFTASSSLQTGYAVAVRALGGLDGEVQIKLLCQNAEASAYHLSDKVTVETAKESYQCTKADFPSKYEALKAQVYNGVDSVNLGMLVMFGLSSDGKINKIKIPHVISTREEYNSPPAGYDFFKLDYLVASSSKAGTSMSFTKSNMTIGLSIALDDNAQIYYIPPSGSTDSEDNFIAKAINSVANGASFKLSEQFSGADGQLEAYSTGGSSKLVNAIVYASRAGADNEISVSYNDSFLVTSITRIINDDGEKLCKISGLQNGKETVLHLDDETLLSSGSMKSVSLRNTVSAVISESKKTLECGDIIRYSLGADGYVSSIALMYDAASKKVSYYDPTTYLRYSSQYRFTYGYVSDIYSGFAELMLYDKNITDYNCEPHRLKAFSRIYVYDFKQEAAMIGTVDDVSVGDSVFVVDNYRTPRELFVFKGDASK